MWLIAYHLARSALLLEVEAAEAALAAPKDSDLRVMGLWVRVVEADDIVRFKLGLLEAREGDANFVGFVLGLVGAFRRSSTADGSLSAPPRAFFVSANDGVEKNFCVASSTFEGDDALELCDVRALRWGELGRVSVLTFAVLIRHVSAGLWAGTRWDSAPGCPLIGLLLSEPPLPLTYSCTRTRQVRAEQCTAAEQAARVPSSPEQAEARSNLSSASPLQLRRKGGRSLFREIHYVSIGHDLADAQRNKSRTLFRRGGPSATPSGSRHGRLGGVCQAAATKWSP